MNLSFAHFVTVAENRSAVLAVKQTAECLSSRRSKRVSNPLFIHGPSGTGKTFLTTAFVKSLTRKAPGTTIAIAPAAEMEGIATNHRAWKEAEAGTTERPWDVDLLILEDLQFLSSRGVPALVQLFDDRLARQGQMVFTAAIGPRQLPLPARLTTRLASGLVVEMKPWLAASRFDLLKDKAQRRQIAVSQEVLGWLAEHLNGGGRQVDGAIAKLEALARLHPRTLDLATVAPHFAEELEASRPSVNQITEKVCGHFHVEPKQLQSARRSRQILVPRQVSMYLARQLTKLSLDQIGDYFGGRDHSTVLHACRKVEQTLAQGGVLSSTVRQLQSSLM
jgi:chromosomal replication initiator protein